MNKHTKKTIMFIALILLLLGVGYAAFNTNLSIHGTTEIHNNNFAIKFSNIVEKEGSVTAKTSANITGDSLITFDAVLTNPGDYYGFSVDIFNEGTLDAMVESITVTELTEEQQKYLTFTVLDENELNIKEKDLLKRGDTRTVNVLLMYKSEPVAYPESSSESLTIEISINYIEADETAVDITEGKDVTEGGNVTEGETEMLIGNRFDSPTGTFYSATNRISAQKNIYLTAGTTISLKNPTTYKFAIPPQRSEEITQQGSYANGGWSTEEYTIETDGWYGFMFARIDNADFNLGTTDPNTLDGYVTIS